MILGIPKNNCINLIRGFSDYEYTIIGQKLLVIIWLYCIILSTEENDFDIQNLAKN